MGRSRKDPYSLHGGNFCRPGGGVEKNVSDNSKYIRTSKGGRGLTSYFLRGGGMDVFWNDPMPHVTHRHYIHMTITYTQGCK
jgi:hypothetical protein